MSASRVRREPTRQPTAGIYGTFDRQTAKELNQRGVSVKRVEDLPNPIELQSMDCLIIDKITATVNEGDVHAQIREMHSTYPLIFLVGNTDTRLPPELADDPNTVIVPRTDDGVPIALLSARCKRFARDGESLEVSRTDSTTEYRTGGFTFYALWAFAIATYGIGDLVSTLVALLFVPGLFEGNPIILAVLQRYGIPGFVGIKIVVFAGALWMGIRGARDGDWVEYYVPPVVVGIVGTALTVWNTLLITGIVG